MSSGKWRPFCLSLNVLKIGHQDNSPSNGHQDVMPYCKPLTASSSAGKKSALQSPWQKVGMTITLKHSFNICLQIS